MAKSNFEDRLLEVQEFLRSGRLDFLLANDKWTGGMNWLIAHYGNLVPLPATKDKLSEQKKTYDDLNEIVDWILEIKGMVDEYFKELGSIEKEIVKVGKTFTGDNPKINKSLLKPYNTRYGRVFDTKDVELVPFWGELSLTNSKYKFKVFDLMKSFKLCYSSKFLGMDSEGMPNVCVTFRKFNLGVDSKGRPLQCDTFFEAVLYFAELRELNQNKGTEALAKPTGPKR